MELEPLVPDEYERMMVVDNWDKLRLGRHPERCKQEGNEVEHEGRNGGGGNDGAGAEV